MNRAELTNFIKERYGAAAETLWMKFPSYAVFRHAENQKWFAIIMDIPAGKLGLDGGGRLDVLNVKCDPLLIGALRQEQGVYPAYHMNKERWVTVVLDGSVPDEKIEWLLAQSYGLTAGKAKRR